jgi:osmoprotectant transport system ATP-binding protein
VIELREVRKSFGETRAVDGVSLRIEPGTITALIGASGSGKSTLLRLINRLVERDAGQILVDGMDIRNASPEALRRRMGYVIQSIGLFPHWTVARNIATVPVLLGWSPAQIAARVEELLVLLGLDPAHFRGRYPHQLSGGQQQRVGVARALAARPAVLLMDEPFGALDPHTRQTLQHELARLQRALGSTVVLITHDIDEALRLGDRVVLLERGRILQDGPPVQLLTRPASDHVAQFMGRAALGPRLLALRTVAQILRPNERADGAPLAPDQSLQEALSEFLARGVDRLPVADAAARTLGVVRFIDLLHGPR